MDKTPWIMSSRNSPLIFNQQILNMIIKIKFFLEMNLNLLKVEKKGVGGHSSSSEEGSSHPI